jgi:signal transduction histidine kinase
MRTPSVILGTSSRVDAVLDRLWMRFGNRLVPVGVALLWLVYLASATIGAAVGAATTELSLQQQMHLVLTMDAATLLGGVVAVAVALRQSSAWQAVAQTGAADDIWTAAESLPSQLVRTSSLAGYGLVAPLMVVAMAVFVNPDVPWLVAVTMAILLVITFLMVLGAFATPLLVRALLRGVGHLDGRSRQLAKPTGFQWRLLVAIPVTSATAATTGVWIGAGAGTSGSDLLIRSLIATTFILALSVPTAFFLSFTTIRTLRDLIEGTDRVKRGEFAESVPELSIDEFGVLARSFNEMMDGLADRQRLAGEVRESRARVVAAADESRKRIERNVHDGAQQRLVALALDLQMHRDGIATDESLNLERRTELVAQADAATEALRGALAELRELARGLHPSVLTTDGLGPAIEQLVSRSPIPVSVEVPETRFPEAVETACYFTAAEALANVAKYAEATDVAVHIEQQDGRIRLQVSDNGVGGADPKAGSGLTGLVDRIAALDGTLTVDSPVGVGTTVTVELPLSDGAPT